MTHAIEALKQDRTFLTLGGTETYLLFQQGFPLREASAFEVFDDEAAWQRLSADYLTPILDGAAAHGHGLMVDTLVWRAHPDYVATLGRPKTDLVRCNELAVRRTREAVVAWRRGGKGADTPVLLTADVGPRGDGYQVADRDVTPEQARDYHRRQIEVLAQAGADLVCATTMTSVAEAIGVVQAARDCGMPIVVSPTVETDGTLPDGVALGEFVRRVEEATGGAPLHYIVNCAHPTHLAATLARAAAERADWLRRFKGIRANASRKSHAELDECTELDRGNPDELGREVAALAREHDLTIVGGCCGTDAEHVVAIARATAGAGSHAHAALAS